MKELMFMAHINHEHIDYVEETLNNYDIGLYLIGMEGNNDPIPGCYEHMHFLVEMEETDYHKFSKRVFKDKFKLRGRAVQGKPRQYGKVKHIDDIENAKTYTVKDGNVRTNMSQDELKKYIDKSFEKVEKTEFLDECAEELERRYIESQTSLYGPAEYAEGGSFSLYKLRMLTITIMREKGLKSISRSRVENVIYRFVMKSGTPFHATVEDIYEMLYP